MSEGTSHGSMKSMAGGCERTFRNLVVGRASGRVRGLREAGHWEAGHWLERYEWIFSLVCQQGERRVETGREIAQASLVSFVGSGLSWPDASLSPRVIHHL
jgi:hypothetical protein